MILLFTSGLVESQVSELVTMRRSLCDLEAQHERASNHYEDEIKRLRSDLVAARQSGAPPISLGIPGRSPHQLEVSAPILNTPAMSEPQSGILRHRERDVPERDARDRPKDLAERDLDRVVDQRDAKRHKTRRDYPGSFIKS